jgi:predicted DNA-binding transcriptional regulator AlpA
MPSTPTWADTRPVAALVSTPPPSPMLRLPQVAERLGVSPRALCGMLASGRFPQGVQLTPRATVWPADLVERWIKDELAKANGLTDPVPAPVEPAG